MKLNCRSGAAKEYDNNSHYGFVSFFTLKASVVLLCALVVLLSLLPPSEAAQQRSAAQRAADERRDFASFIDGFFAGATNDWHIPGLSFVAVRNGEVLYKQAYGLADLETGRPVSADATLFRVGAVSELVTAAALLQLVEKNRLTMDEDVNFYLRRWKLPQTYEEPVTLRHLLTHTGGFDAKELEIGALTAEDERNYGAKLPKTMPQRYAPPGLFFSKSEMGYTLLGSIIERYSRQNFAQAVEKYIFTPLGMKNSGFTLTEEKSGQLAVGYDRNGNAVDYQYFIILPAVGMSTTADDMGKLMIALLQGGAYGKNRILQQMYVGSLLRRHFSPHPKIEGTALGTQEKTVSGLRTLQQQGRLNGYSSFLMLVPDKNFGMFFTANIAELAFSEELTNAVVRRFLGEQGGDDLQVARIDHHPTADIVGYYRHNSIARHTAEKLTSFMEDQLHVTVSGNLVKIAHTRDKDKPVESWVPAGISSDMDDEDIYLPIDENGNVGEGYLYFQRDTADRVVALVKNEVSATYDKLPTRASYYWQIVFLVCFALTALVTIFGLLVGSAVNKSKLPWEKGYRSATELWGLSFLFCLIQAAFIAGMALSVHYLGHEFFVFVPYQVKALFVIPLTGAFLLAWFWFRYLVNVINPEYHWAEKIVFLPILLVESGYMFYLADWRLLGFMF